MVRRQSVPWPRPLALRGQAPTCASTTGGYCTPLQPTGTQVNPSDERGWAFMWHSHNEREITTNNVFPGGMLMMMLVDSREFCYRRIGITGVYLDYESAGLGHRSRRTEGKLLFTFDVKDATRARRREP